MARILERENEYFETIAIEAFKNKKNNFFYINLKTFYYAYIESKTFDGPRMLNLMK
jgi:hypothetical protein